jgi:hypothetical protein
MLRIGICVPHTELHHFANGREASPIAWCSRSPFSPSYHNGCFAVVDVWDQSPHAVNKALHSLGGEEVKTPSLPRTISIIGPKWLLWLCLCSINNEVLKCSTCSLGL